MGEWNEKGRKHLSMKIWPSKPPERVLGMNQCKSHFENCWMNLLHAHNDVMKWVLELNEPWYLPRPHGQEVVSVDKSQWPELADHNKSLQGNITGWETITNRLVTLCLSFPGCKMGWTIEPSSELCYGEKMSRTRALPSHLTVVITNKSECSN